MEIFNKKSEKLEAASLLLRDAQFSIKEIAYSFGYSSPKYFGQCFKKIKGVSPLIYRRKLKNLNSGLLFTRSENYFLMQLKKYIEINLINQDYNIQNIAFDLNVSKSTLYRKVKSLTDLSVIEYINSIRFENAIILLKSNKYRIFEVAYLVGFNDPKYFCKCFKSKFGYTPSNYIELFIN